MREFFLSGSGGGGEQPAQLHAPMLRFVQVPHGGSVKSSIRHHSGTSLQRSEGLNLPSRQDALGASQAVHHEDSIGSALRVCTAEYVRFSDAWGCVQARYVVGQINEADPRLKAFLKLGDELARQAEDKKLSDREANKLLTAGLPGEVGKKGRAEMFRFRKAVGRGVVEGVEKGTDEAPKDVVLVSKADWDAIQRNARAEIEAARRAGRIEMREQAAKVVDLYGWAAIDNAVQRGDPDNKESKLLYAYCESMAGWIRGLPDTRVSEKDAELPTPEGNDA